MDNDGPLGSPLAHLDKRLTVFRLELVTIS